MNIKDLEVKGFWCISDNELKEHIDSMLFDSETQICGIELTDNKNRVLKLDLMIYGDVNIYNEEKDEQYRHASDFPEKLKNELKNGKTFEELGFEITNNNWYETIYTIVDNNGNYIEQDGILFKASPSDYTQEKMLEELKNIATDIIRRCKNV